MSITCVIADDHPPVLQFLSRYLSNNGITITASTRDGAEALRKIEQTCPTVAVLDARMPFLSGLDVLRRLSDAGCPTRVILYTGYGDDGLLNDALDAGVGGLIDKEAPLDDLVRAIGIVAEGGTYLDPTAAAALISQRHRNRNRELTQREREVLRLLADGNSNEQIASVLTISPQTVRTHVQKAMEKLGATTRVQAVATALRDSLIS
ncbi:MAG TPA: response regulator transcription factor [Gaiellaceae bacterium]|nr:response regulator transcription factor [Gaiellaceae bacterium]